jgi:hypothetical protein
MSNGLDAFLFEMKTSKSGVHLHVDFYVPDYNKPTISFIKPTISFMFEINLLSLTKIKL